MKLLLFSALVLFSCNSKEAIEVDVLTNQVNSLNVKQSDYNADYIKDDTVAVEGSRTLITYKISNNTDKTYYFNVEGYDKIVRKVEYIKVGNALLGIYDTEHILVKPRISWPSLDYDPDRIYAEYLDYRKEFKLLNRNFILHPNESRYFEWFVVLPFGNLLEGVNYSVVLNDKEKYFVKVLVGSTSNHDYISRTDLKTIEENDYEIFDGVVASKNTIPLVIANP